VGEKRRRLRVVTSASPDEQRAKTLCDPLFQKFLRIYRRLPPSEQMEVFAKMQRLALEARVERRAAQRVVDDKATGKARAKAVSGESQDASTRVLTLTSVGEPCALGLP
jgi:hypothetical protein